MGPEVTAALVAAVVSGAISLVGVVLQSRQARTEQSLAAQQDITAKYDALVAYRLQHPEVLSLARRWTSDNWVAIYDPEELGDYSWTIYYGYVELITLYASAVLYAHEHRLITRDLFDRQHEPLIRLLVAEHYPILSEITLPGAYVTDYLVRHLERLTAIWDWKAAHDRLLT